jgi:hypothetical protein
MGGWMDGCVCAGNPINRFEVVLYNTRKRSQWYYTQVSI